MSEQSLLPESGAVAVEAPLSILCVDDEENILSSLSRLFRREPFQTLTASSGEEGLAILKSTPNIGLILSDFRMPEMTGAVFLQAAGQIAPDSYRMILTGYADLNAAISAINEGGASRFLTKPFNNLELIQCIRDGLDRYQRIRENQNLTDLVRKQNQELAEWNDNLKKRVLQQTAQLRTQMEQQKNRSSEFCGAVAQTFLDALGQRNAWLSRHSRTVAALTDQITQNLGLGYQLCEEIRVAALLHDIGLLGMPDRFLAKRTQMKTPEELKEFQSHSIKGQIAVENIELLRDVGIFIRQHHEAYDGSGYPDGLSGEQISLGGQIIALANWIENAFSKEIDADAKYQVSKRLEREMGRLFDPVLASAAKYAVSQVLHDLPVPKDISEDEVTIADIHPGMILSRKLYSFNGLLLLERGTRLTRSSVESLQRQSQHISLRSVAYVWK
jgi:response regulator RpfG family c-di-GMP phosphodiesterase